MYDCIDDTNTMKGLKYYVCNQNELISLCWGDNAKSTKATRYRMTLLTVMITYSLSLIFADASSSSGNSQSCDYSCVPGSCSSSSSSSTELGSSSSSMDWGASMLVIFCDKILKMGGMNMYLESLEQFRGEHRGCMGKMGRLVSEKAKMSGQKC